MKGIACPEVSYVPQSRVHWALTTGFNQGPQGLWKMYLVKVILTPNHQHILQMRLAGLLVFLSARHPARDKAPSQPGALWPATRDLW